MQATAFLNSLYPTTTESNRGSVFRYFIKQSNAFQAAQWPAKEGLWSGSATSSKESDIQGGLLEGQRGFSSQPKTTEMYLRTGTNHWAMSKQTNDADLFMVLDRKVGREGSLVDADVEIRATMQRLDMQ